MSKLVGIITAAALVMVLLGTFAYGASNALADSPPDWSGRSGCTTEESAVQPYLADSNGNMTSTADGDALTFKLTICPATEDEHDNYSSVNAGASAACNCNYNQGVVFWGWQGNGSGYYQARYYRAAGGSGIARGYGSCGGTWGCVYMAGFSNSSQIRYYQVDIVWSKAAIWGDACL